MTKVTEHHAQRLMDYFPVQMKVSGQKIIFCGGQQEVLAKVRLLIKTSAELLVFAPAFCEGLLDLSGHPRLRLIDRFPQDEDFDGAVLCYLGVENDAELKQLKASAARQHVPVCAIDIILSVYLQGRSSLNETFIQFYRRVGLTPFNAALYPDRLQQAV